MLINTAVHLYVLGPARRDWSRTVTLTFRQNVWTSKTSVPRVDGRGRRGRKFSTELALQSMADQI